MRISSIAFVSLIAAFGGAQLAGCASDSGSRATGQVLDDGALTARVKTAIARDASLGAAKDVNVTTYRGVVQLSGFVESEDVARRAEEIARSVQGVQSVKNDLRVNPS
jgi:hyperosmotically inducible periplasmic protein